MRLNPKKMKIIDGVVVPAKSSRIYSDRTHRHFYFYRRRNAINEKLSTNLL